MPASNPPPPPNKVSAEREKTKIIKSKRLNLTFSPLPLAKTLSHNECFAPPPQQNPAHRNRRRINPQKGLGKGQRGRQSLNWTCVGKHTPPPQTPPRETFPRKGVPSSFQDLCGVFCSEKGKVSSPRLPCTRGMVTVSPSGTLKVPVTCSYRGGPRKDTVKRDLLGTVITGKMRDRGSPLVCWGWEGGDRAHMVFGQSVTVLCCMYVCVVLYVFSSTIHTTWGAMHTRIG